MKRFNTKYRVDPDTGCWVWIAGCGGGGYGAFWENKRQVKAHRTSWRIHKGKIPKGLLVLHKCDNRKCVNPDHLFLGTHQDNMDDMCKKGRQPFGENNPKAKLSEQDVLEIKTLLNKGKLFQREIAEKFSVTRASITAQLIIIDYGGTYERFINYNPLLRRVPTSDIYNPGYRRKS